MQSAFDRRIDMVVRGVAALVLVPLLWIAAGLMLASH